MKKHFLIFIIVITQINCSNNEETNCDWETISSIDSPQETTDKLNTVFSENNNIINNSEENDFLLKITNQQQLDELSENNLDINFDFENYFLLGGRIRTSSISNKISIHQLKVCNTQSSYNYEIIIEKCTECYPALGFLYFWNIYPKSISEDEITLSIK